MSKGHNRIRPSSQGKGKKEKDMAQNEVMAMELTAKEEKQRNFCITSYNKAMENCEKSTWHVAQVIYETVNREDFKKLFGSKKAYADVLGVNKSTVTKMESAYERKLLLADSYTATQISEMGKVETVNLLDFIETEKVTVEDTCKAIREKADNYVKKLNEEEELASEEATEEVEEAVEVKNIYCRFYCYVGTERANVQDVKISQKQMEEILAIINR